MKTKKIFITVLLLVGIFFIKSFGQEKIIGPYLQQMSDDKVTICWSVLDGTTTVSTSDKRSRVNRYIQHETIIPNLQPNTTYNYNVFDDGTDKGKGTFTTFPATIQDFHFAVLGDTRSRHDVHRKVVNRIIGEDPLFVINTGDLVGNGNSMDDWEHFFDINKNLIKNVPYYTVLGNHEKNSDNYFNFFKMPGNGSYYFFNVGDALFVILDMEGEDFDTPAYLEGADRNKFWTNINKDYFDKEKQWLENVLEMNKSAGYIFVFFHPTWYSIKKSRVAEAELRREYWGDIFERHNVTAVLNGHDHYYHHAIHGGTHYIVTAGGGAPLYATDAIQPETVKFKKIEHYMRIDVGEDFTVMKAIDINGELIEEIKVSRRE